MDIIKRKKTIIISQPHQVTVTGKLITFNTDIVAPIEIVGTGNITLAGKNLLNPATYNNTIPYSNKGVKFTLNANGTITVNGKVEAGSSTSPQVAFLWYPPFTEDYYFCANAPFSTTYNEIYVYDNTVGARCKEWDGTTNSKSSATNRPLLQAKFEKSHCVSLNVRITLGKDKQYNNDVFSPMVMSKTCTDTTFEAYKGITQSVGSVFKSFKGINNIWSDNDTNITIKYWTY